MLSTKPPVVNPSRPGPIEAYGVAPPPKSSRRWRMDHKNEVDSADFEFKKPCRERFPWVPVGLMVGACAAGMLASIKQDYLLGQIVVPILGLSGLHGLLRGAFRKAAMLIVTTGILFAVVSQPNFADPIVRGILGRSSVVGDQIACAAAIILSWLITGYTTKRIRRRLVRGRPTVLATDRFFGTGLGLAEGAFLVLCLSWAVDLVEPHVVAANARRNPAPTSFQADLAQVITRLTDEIYKSPLEPIVREANLLAEIPAVRDAIDTASQGGRVDLEAFGSALHGQLLEAVRRSNPAERNLIESLIDRQTETHDRREDAYRRIPAPQSQRR